MQDDQYKLYVATSKKETIAKEVLEYFDLTNYFTGIYGSLDTRFTKESIIKACLTRENCDPKKTLIIGDTAYDIDWRSQKSDQSCWGALEFLHQARITRCWSYCSRENTP
ncbi:MULTISPECIES: HAD hydrolase-like protein [Streptococcus]|uniref:HAD hydrolase-like protein n=1 Tax=Streptococcus TaxID=1301 RepID=UPI000BA46A42|nr:HAD hydrolase-like protein [Streptococcus acidominimus]